MPEIYEITMRSFIKKISNRPFHLVKMSMRKGTILTKKIFAKTRDICLTKHLTFEVRELFFQHNGTTDFSRYDMIVRLLAVENEYGLNDYGFCMYCRMQEARQSKAWVETSVKRFKTLIESYKHNGYNTQSEIELDCNLHLIDGSHRMAMAMFHKVLFISAKVRPYKTSVFYGIEWFLLNGFTTNECEILTKRYRQLYDNYTIPFVCTLWSPIQKYYDEITKHLSMFGTIREVMDFEYSASNYQCMAKAIYHVGDLENRDIEEKLSKMRTQELNKIRLITIVLNTPRFRLNKSNNNTLSTQSELIEKLIRDAYKHKKEEDFYDPILCVGNNFSQNEQTYNFFKTQVNLQSDTKI